MHTTTARQEIQPLRKVRFEVCVWTKIYTQAVLRKCREQGYEVSKESGMYEVKMPDGEKELVLRAAPGMRGYLVRFHPDLLQAT